MPTEVIPTRVLDRPGAPVGLEVRGLGAPGTLLVRHLGEVVHSRPVDHDGVLQLDALPVGGYSVELGPARTAFEVTDDPRAVLRYGFVADFRPGRDLAGVADNIRRLHLTGIQFYDWAYRHADLVGGGENYQDALGQPVSLAAVRDLIATCHHVGAAALGYAAVYAVGAAEWPTWAHDALLTATGTPYGLGDFLWLVDPAAPDWLAHFTKDLAAAVATVGFDGFHLDQYGYPKRAHTPDGQDVEVARSFCRLIESVRQTLPGERLVFNNVNDFPTWATGKARQDAVYIEVWDPQRDLAHLAQTIARARVVAGGKPVVIAAYQHVYDQAAADVADRAAALTMATIFSHGATHLLAGEADRILVDPYYVRNHQVEGSTADLLRRYYDFAVAHRSLLFPAELVDVTASFAGSYNDDLDVTYAQAQVAELASAGQVWRRITATPSGGYVLHLINLVGQPDTRWDAPRDEPADLGAGQLRMRRMGPTLPRIRWADPDRQPHLVDVEVTVDGDFVTAMIPAPHFWQIVLVEPAPTPAITPTITP